MQTSTPSRGSHALRGSLLLLAVVSPVVVGLLAVGVAREQRALVEASFRLAVLVLAAGASAGAVYDATRGMRSRDGLAPVASWWLVGGAAAALLLVAIRVFLVPLLAPGSSDALYATHLTGLTGARYLGGVVVVFGWAMTDVTTAPAPSGVRRERQRFMGSTLGVVALLFTVWAIATVAGDPAPARVLPENAVEARRVIADAERDARAHPDDGEAQFAYGLSLMQLGRYVEARPVLARAEQLRPDDAWASSALGWVLIEQRNYSAALPHIQRAVKLDPEYGAAYHNLAWALWKLARLDEAEAAYGHAVKLELREPDLAADYALLLFQNRKSDRAIAQIYRAIRLDSTAAHYHALAGYFLRSKARFADARAEFQRTVVLDPSRAGNWIQLAITDYLMGDAHGADSAFAAAATRDSALLRIPELRTMWEAARKGRAAPVEAESMIQFQLDSSAASH